LTSPHRFAASRLAEERLRPDARIAALNAPRVAVLVGGASRHHHFSEGDVARLVAGLRALADDGAALMATTSRRTPLSLVTALRALVVETRGFVWDGTGPNPYGSMLATADAIVVTADSVNMLSEAVATGAPVLVFEPTGGAGRLGRLLDELKLMGVIKSFGGKLERYTYEKLDSTPVIAQAVAQGFAAHRLRLGADEPALDGG
jgi:mitochondrial fission protein ELM1